MGMLTAAKYPAFDLKMQLHRVSLSFALFLILYPDIYAQNKLELLAIRIRNGSVEQKRDALFEIRNLRSAEASRIAIPALTDKSEIVRATAAASFVFLPKDEAAQLLLQLLNDKSDLVRREAAYALGEVGNPAAVELLVQALRKDKIAEVKSAAAIALGKIGDVRAVEPLLLILKERPREDVGFLRRSAARSIGEIARITSTGRRHTTSPQNFLPEKYKDLRESDNLVMQFPVFEAAVVVLSQILQNTNEENDTRREAAFALGAIGNKSAIYVLEAHQNSVDPYLAEICKEALLKLRTK